MRARVRTARQVNVEVTAPSVHAKSMSLKLVSLGLMKTRRTDEDLFSWDAALADSLANLRLVLVVPRAIDVST